MVTLTADGIFKPICKNCIKNYQCSGQAECLAIMLEHIYKLENGEDMFFTGQKVRIKTWNELRDICYFDGDDWLEFFDGEIFYEELSHICGETFEITDVNDDKIFILDKYGYSRPLCKDWVWKVN